MADIAIEFIKDHKWELNGNKKHTLKRTRMTGDPEFLNQFIKAKAATEMKQSAVDVRTILNDITEKENE